MSETNKQDIQNTVQFTSRSEAEIARAVASIVSVSEHQADAVIRLTDDGATIPFIARYRKEATGNLDEKAIGDIISALEKERELDKRRIYILTTINDSGKLKCRLREQIENAATREELEDLFLPYKPHRRTRATVAREAGLGPFANEIMSGRCQCPEKRALAFVNGIVADAKAAIQGASDIIAEEISENSNIRAGVRRNMARSATVCSSIPKGKESEASNFENYNGFSRRLSATNSHQYLALCRGENEGLLRLGFDYGDAPSEFAVRQATRRLSSGKCHDIVAEAAADGYKRLMRPSIENELRAAKKLEADSQAIAIFADNARQLLLSPPLGARPIIAIDPGYRTGCKVVCLDKTGQLVHHTVIYPTPPRNDTQKAEAILRQLADRYKCEAIAIGNGTAGRETEQFVKSIDFGREISVHLVSESGASIYSASEIAREEFPDQDITVRGAVSIGRRLMDPLAELVKIDPKSIGVGQYQHDVDQVMLRDKLSEVVSSCVNLVGVDVNTASAQLLTYVSGIGPALAKAIVAKRSADGPFTTRKELLKVPRLGTKAFEQSAGFLRIAGGENPLDNTAVHPETYHIVRRIAADLGVDVTKLVGNTKLIDKIDIARYTDDKFGKETLRDIVSELQKPGRDPRTETEATVFDNNIHTIDDLSVGMKLKGVVNNITSFGAFVDIGIKHSGLVHLSQMTDRYISSPSEVVRIGQTVDVTVIEIDMERNRVSLSMKSK